MAASQPGATPSSPSPPALNVSPTISKHASSYPPSLLISHLLAAAINHLLFARGQIAFPVSTLQKRAPPPGARRDRKRDATLQALEEVGRHVGAALSAGDGQGDGEGMLPLLVLFGPSALSPLEAFAISIRHPTPTPSSSAHSNGETSTGPPPSTLKKLLSTLEQRLVRFLIATEELQDALANTLRPTKMHLFVLRPEGWRAEGWKPRRGFRAQLGRVWGGPKAAEEGGENGEDQVVVESGAAQGGAERQPPQRGEEQSSSTHIGKGLPTQPANLAAAVDPTPASSTSTTEEDVGILSEALSPLKKRRRPPLVARTSSSYSSAAGGGVNGFQSPRASSAMLLKTPSSSKVVKTTAMRQMNGGENVLWSPQPAAAMRRMDFSAVQGARTSFEPVRSGLTLEPSSSEDEERPSAAARAPPPTNSSSASGSKALNGTASGSRRPPAAGIVDDRPPGSRLFPASSRSGSSTSLLARSRISPREKSSQASGVDGGGAAAHTRARPRAKLKGPKGAAFFIDCGGGDEDKEEGSSEDGAAGRRLGFESLDEKGCALPGWQWFQCEVSVPAYLGS